MGTASRIRVENLSIALVKREGAGTSSGSLAPLLEGFEAEDWADDAGLSSADMAHALVRRCTGFACAKL